MRKRKAFAGIFAPNFKRACGFLIKNSRGAFSPEVFSEHFNARIIQQEANFLFYNKNFETLTGFCKKDVFALPL